MEIENGKPFIHGERIAAVMRRRAFMKDVYG